MVKCRKSRTNERGAAVFIVVMVVSLLTAIGVFAARSASLVDVAAGYDRQAVQARGAADYAGRLITAELGSGDARAYLDRFAAGRDTCGSNYMATAIQPGAPLPCTIFTTDDLNVLIAQRSGDSNQRLFAGQSEAASGSLGPRITTGSASSALEGLMRVEIIDAFRGETAPGSPAAGGFMDVQFTVTAYAQVRNSAGSTAWCANTATSTGASVQALRAHITVPNIPK